MKFIFQDNLYERYREKNFSREEDRKRIQGDIKHRMDYNNSTIAENFLEGIKNEGYFLTPINSLLPDMAYMEGIKETPLISFLINFRTIKLTNGNNDILSLFDSYMANIKPENRYLAEFIIKFDIDDEFALHKFILEDTFRNKYKDLIIRPCAFRRWEGRSSIYLTYSYLFSQRNPTSKWIGFLTDDFTFTRDIIEDIKHLDKKYTILNTQQTEIALKGIDNWRTNLSWAKSPITECYPIITPDIIEICGGMGWQSNIDNWLGLIGAILYKQYNYNIFNYITPFYSRNTEDKLSLNLSDNYPAKFNKEMFVDDTTSPKNDYYFNLVEQQAKNIYLNIKENK